MKIKSLTMVLAGLLAASLWGAANDTVLTFSTKGPDRYADGSAVRDGEEYALVWTKDGAAFGGFAADGSLVSSDDRLVMRASLAQGGCCPETAFEIAADAMSQYQGGAFALYALDTRTAGATGVADVAGVQIADMADTLPRTMFLATASATAPLGVTINGVDVSAGSGLGWKTDPLVAGYFDLTGGVDYVVSGTNLDGKVMLAMTRDATLTISNLYLVCKKENECCIWATSNVTVKVLLAGENKLDASDVRAAGISIEHSSKLYLDKAPGLTDEQARLTVIGGEYGAGIAVAVRAETNEEKMHLYIDGGTIEAYGGAGAAGIGGNFYNNYTYGGFTADINIRGGHILAKGGEGLASIMGYEGSGAGIGSAANNYYATTDIRISGGYVEAYGGRDAAGIGSGFDSRGGDVIVSGGTVIATRGERYGDTYYTGHPGYPTLKATDMKNGWFGDSGENVGALMLTGGSVMMTHVVAGEEAPETRPDASNATERVWCVTVPDIEAKGAVTITGLEDYGTKDIVAIEGKAYLWLPNGTYEFIADGFTYAATVDGQHVTAGKIGPAEPWIAYVDADGSSKYCKDYVVVTNETATFEDGRWYAVTGTVSRGQITVHGSAHLILCDDASLTVTGENDKAGVLVNADEGRSITIYGQMNGTGRLIATGGERGAGIGGCNEAGGAVTINGGMVTAIGGLGAAGVGGGNGHSNSGGVTINGGVVTATGGYGAAGIGGGHYNLSGPGGGDVTINGGTVTATGGEHGAGIGAGNWEQCKACGTIAICGGQVIAQGGQDAADIGGGEDGSLGDIRISGGIFGMTVEDRWVADGYAAVDNPDTETRETYPYAVVPAGGGVKIISIAVRTVEGQAQVEATFASTEGATYNLLRSEDLTTPIGQWTVVATGLAGVGENFMLADKNPPPEKAFYTVVVVEPLK